MTIQGQNAVQVRPVDEENGKIGLGIYNFPNLEPGQVPSEGEHEAVYLAGVLLEPHQAYEIAQLLTRSGWLIEDRRNGTV